MAIKTIDYKIMSEEWGSVQLPEKPYHNAKEIIDELSKPISGRDLLNFVYEHSYLTNPSTFNITRDLLACEPGSKKSKELQDLLFLDLSMFYLNSFYELAMKNLKKEYENTENQMREELKNLAEPIMGVLEKIKLKRNLPHN